VTVRSVLCDKHVENNDVPRNCALIAHLEHVAKGGNEKRRGMHNIVQLNIELLEQFRELVLHSVASHGFAAGVTGVARKGRDISDSDERLWPNSLLPKTI
jgi:hypothetical protein